ncbi:MAG: uroporphyrinogen-III C-methyltransferase [Candidatus Hydrogenedentota bacterium]
MKGKVYLIGAGPGDKGLITQKAVKILEKADVIIYDRLVNPDIIKEIPQNIEKIYSGKKGWKKHTSQEKINKIMVNLAKKGKIVARLKGGDPFVFGRGAEETLYLKKYKIPFEIIPGITSALSCPVYAGIPITHRGISSSITIITGNEDPSKKESSINWNAVAHTRGTLIILMGMMNLNKITERLIKEGMAQETPVCIVMEGTHNHQKTLITNLKDAYRDCKKQGFKQPAVIVIGSVVNFKKDLEWFETRPLHQKKIIITRALHQSEEIKDSLTDLGAVVYEIPSIEIIDSNKSRKKLYKIIKNSSSYDLIIFTSANGIEVFKNHLDRIGYDSRWFGDKKIAVIGEATKDKLLNEFKIKADIIPEDYISESLAKEIIKHKHSVRKAILFCAERTGEILTRLLKKKGIDIEILPLYRIRKPKQTKKLFYRIRNEKIDYIIFTSPSTFINFFNINGTRQFLKKLKIISIGPITSKTIRRYGYKVYLESKKHSISGILQFLCRGIV